MSLISRSSATRSWFASALAAAESISFRMSRAAPRDEKRSSARASSIGNPRTWSATRRAFLGATRTKRARALTTGRFGASPFALAAGFASAFDPAGAFVAVDFVLVAFSALGFAGAFFSAVFLAGAFLLAGAFAFASEPLAAGFLAAGFLAAAFFGWSFFSVFFSSAIRRYSLSLAVPAPEWARKVRVGANSPSLWPTIDSEM